MARLFAQQFEEFEGEVKRDTSTEDELELVIETDITAIQAAVDETAKEWNNRYAACNVSGKAVEAYDDEGTVLVYTEGVIRLEWELDEWQALPNHMDMSHCVDDLLQSSYGTIHDPEGGGYSNAYLDGDSPYIGKLTN